MSIQDIIESRTVTIPAKYCGPPNSGNGGYMCALVARCIEGIAQVYLRAPAPLEKPLTVDLLPGNRALMRDGETVLAEGSPGYLDERPPPAPTWEVAVAASLRSPMRTYHPYPTCYGCGPERARDDGLRIFTAQEGTLPTGFGIWEPNEALGATGQSVDEKIVWIALDCGTGILPVVPAREMFGQKARVMTGMMTARFDRPVIIGNRYTTRSWLTATEGRKLHLGSAIYDATGVPVASSQSLWFALPPKE